MENEQANLLVVFSGKTLNGMPPSIGGRQVGGAIESIRRSGPVRLKTSKKN